MTDQLERTVTQQGFSIRDEPTGKVLELPIVVCGEVKLPTPENSISLSYGDDMEVRIPRLEAADVARIREADNRDIAALSVDDVAIFLNDLCKKWIDEDYEFRQLVTETIAETAGYVGPSIYYDLGLLSTALRRIKVYDMLESEIGDPYLLDEWLPRKTVYLHAEPRGKVTHIMVGNIPMAGLFSIVRSVMTKNMTIAKLPKRDAVTSLLFALSFIANAPDHPITKSLTVAYWEPGSTIEDEILDMSDVVCAWGHETSIEPIKKRIRYGTEFVEFGPKRSLHLVGKDAADLDYVAMKAAYDISIYDQVACFSPQETFCEANTAEYVEALGRWLDINLKRMPKSPVSADEKAAVARTRRESAFRGWEVITPEDGGTGWTIVVTDGPCRIAAHPLSRTMFVHPVESLQEAIPFTDKHTQTIAIYPPERAMELADELAWRGIARITEVGRAGRPRPGFAHDGMFPLARLIRYVTIERGVHFKYKFWGIPVEEDDRLFYGRGEDNENPDPMEVWKVYEEMNLK
jgi:long-chain-fatty-acyl-CoA reductase